MTKNMESEKPKLRNKLVFKWHKFLERSFAFQYVSLVTLIVIIAIILAAVIILLGGKRIVDEVLKDIRANFHVVAITEVILAIVILVLRNPRFALSDMLVKQRDKINVSKLVKELELFWIKEAVAQKLANEFQPKNLEMLTQKDYLFSPTHYEFLCNSLKKYIKDNFSQNASFFLNASVLKLEKEKPITNFFKSCVSIIAVVGGSNVLNALFGDEDYVFDYFNNMAKFSRVLLLISIVLVIYLIQKQETSEKTKKAFYLSIINQLKEDSNREQIKNNKKGSVLSEESPTADLPGVGNGSNDNDNADKS